jgi:hypothetical protein
MPTEVKCEQMTTWDFEHCNKCRRFISRHKKGLDNWACKLNNKTASERREFGMIWASAYLKDRGMDIAIPDVVVIPVRR